MGYHRLSGPLISHVGYFHLIRPKSYPFRLATAKGKTGILTNAQDKHKSIPSTPAGALISTVPPIWRPPAGNLRRKDHVCEPSANCRAAAGCCMLLAACQPAQTPCRRPRCQRWSPPCSHHRADCGAHNRADHRTRHAGPHCRRHARAHARAGDRDPGPHRGHNIPIDTRGDTASDAGGNLYVSTCALGDADVNVDQIFKVDTAGMLQIYAGSYLGWGGDGGPATAAEFFCTAGLAFGPRQSVCRGPGEQSGSAH